MALDSTAFATEFSEMFGNFAKQQEEQTEKIVNKLVYSHCYKQL